METNQNLHMEITRDFSVPPERLFKAWNDEADLKKWWKPLGSTLAEVTNELKVGGQICYKFTRNESKEGFNITGEYLEIKEPEKLVYTWNWQLPDLNEEVNNYKLDISFLPKDGGSTIQIVQSGFSTEESIKPHEEGWQNALNSLVAFLDPESIDAKPFSYGAVKPSDVTGYKEVAEQEKVGESVILRFL